MENLDHDVLENILYRLPLGTASSQAKRVCRSWKTILDDKRRNEVEGFLLAFHDFKDNRIQLYFGEEYDHIDIGNDEMMMNYNYSHETLMEMEHCRFTFTSYPGNILVGSCNGLVCFQKEDSRLYKPEPFAICNPLTGEFIVLKPNFTRVWEKIGLVSSGFGYCQSTDEYKVVRLYNLKDEKPVRSHVQVYTIGSNKWRDLEKSIDQTFSSPGIYANGVLHWLDDNQNEIIAFDLEDEEISVLPLPPSEVLEHENSGNELKLLGGNLCWVQFQYTPIYNIDIWVYKKNNHNTNNTRNDTEQHDHKRDYYNGNSWNWVKEFSIQNYYNDPFAILKSNQVLLFGDKSFYCYDLKTQTIDNLGDDNGICCSHIEAIPHANSYVSLKDSGETWRGPGCSAVPQTNGSVLFSESGDAHLCSKRKKQS